MKITFVLKNWCGLAGGVRVISIYANELQKRGHQVLVVSPDMSRSSVSQQIMSLIQGKSYLSSQKKQTSYFSETNVSCKLLSHKVPVTDRDVPDADVVVAAWWETAEWVANLSKSKGAKAYFIQHHEIHDYLPRDRVEATYFLPLHKITIAKWLVDLMTFKYQDPHVSFVPNSVDTEQFFSLPRSKPLIPTVGMMYSQKRWKGSDISIEAYLLAANKIKNLRLIAFGKEKPSPNLPLPLNTEYVRQPPQSKIKDIYAKCNAWLFGSRYEGFGLPILEAMACRTPVIATPAGAAPELLADNRGISVEPENPEDMAKAIINICNLSNSEWQLMSEAAYAKARSYTWQDATDLFEAALYTAIERK